MMHGYGGQQPKWPLNTNMELGVGVVVMGERVGVMWVGGVMSSAIVRLCVCVYVFRLFRNS